MARYTYKHINAKEKKVKLAGEIINLKILGIIITLIFIQIKI